MTFIMKRRVHLAVGAQYKIISQSAPGKQEGERARRGRREGGERCGREERDRESGFLTSSLFYYRVELVVL